jgi:hypothetical protein
MRILNRILGQENAIQTDKTKDFRYVVRRVGNSEDVARLAGSGVHRDQGRNASRVNPFDRPEIESDALLVDQRQDTLQEPAIMTPNQFIGFTCPNGYCRGCIAQSSAHEKPPWINSYPH